MTEREPRKIATGRYVKRSGFFLDHDGSKYVNSFAVFDGDKDTGIHVCDSGDSSVAGSNKRIVTFKDVEYPLLRDAIFAYEDAQAGAHGEGVQEK